MIDYILIFIVVLVISIYYLPTYLKRISINWTLGKLEANLKFMREEINEKENDNSRKNA